MWARHPAGRAGCLGLFAVAMASLLGCNDILGNETVSLWEGGSDAGFGDARGGVDATGADAAGADATAADATDASRDASADGGLCPPTLVNGRPPVTCPPLEAGACGPQNVTTTNFPWVPPTRPAGQCSAAQLGDAFSACLAPQSTAATCSAWQTASAANGTCFACLFSDIGATTYGPYYVYPGTYATFNNAGCVVLLDPCQEPCARIFQSYVDCDYTACASSCMTANGLDACEGEAPSCACVPEADETIACQNFLMASHSPAAVCLTTDTNTIGTLLGRFCGASDGG